MVKIKKCLIDKFNKLGFGLRKSVEMNMGIEKIGGLDEMRGDDERRKINKKVLKIEVMNEKKRKGENGLKEKELDMFKRKIGIVGEKKERKEWKEWKKMDWLGKEDLKRIDGEWGE